MDLFSVFDTPKYEYKPNQLTPEQEEKLGDMMRAAWENDLKILKAKGIIPCWVETDGLLEADEFKLLTLIADNAGRVYYGGEDRKRLADMMGFKAIGNLEAVVKKCLAKELISITTEQHIRDDGMRADRQRVNATEYGMSMLEETEHEKEAERDAEAVPDLGRLVWR